MSDYLFAAPASGGTDSVEVNTHAWLEALIPAADEGAPAWVGADPTNRTLASARHEDRPRPQLGVYRGAGSSTYDARVEMRRLDGTATARP